MTAIQNIEAWLSLVERYIRDVEVAGSNPVASIVKLSENIEKSTFSDFFYSFWNLVFFKKRIEFFLKKGTYQVKFKSNRISGKNRGKILKWAQ